MATNFFSRWSQRKLNKETDEPSEQERIEASAAEVEPAADDSSVDVDDAPEALSSEAEQDLPNSEVEQEVASAEEQDPEKMSLANLLVSQVAPCATAKSYNVPRRSLEHRLHIVLPSGISSLTML